MMKLSVIVIYMWLSLGVESSPTAENLCNKYSLTVLKPNQLKNVTDTNDKQNNKTNNLILINTNLLTKIINKNLIMKFKDDQIKEQANIIKDKDTQIKVLTDRLSKYIPNITCPTESSPETYQSKLPKSVSFKALCNKCGWLTIQKRFDGSVLFNRSWSEYKDGFGKIRGEYFIGLDKLHFLTKSQQYELRIYLKDVNGSTSYEHYDNFQIGNETEAYYLKSLGNFYGTAGDSLTRSIPMKFSTFDRDNDTDPEENCATRLGGWWFYHCAKSSLNGVYYKNGTTPNIDGIFWSSWKSDYYTISLTYTQMMIRPKKNYN